MPTYDVYVWTRFRRLKYPRGLNIPTLALQLRPSFAM
jgi:hypothetical protein